MNPNTQSWYIVKTPDGHCEIVELKENESPETEEFWGPFPSPSEAVARRVGLIRAGKCQPQ